MQPKVRDILEHGLYGIAREHRPAQIEMAETIEHLFTEETSIFMAEGGCGIGKSFAYLIPSLLQAGKRVIVSTGKTTLQDQLIDLDMPILHKAMGSRGKPWGVYKGRRNYGCRMRIKEAPTADLREEYQRFLDNAGQNPADKKTWPGLDPWWWSKINADDCPLTESGCDHMPYCTTNPKDKQLVIANHSLVGIDLSRPEGPGSILGHYDVLILDEGHAAAEIFRSSFTTRLKLKRLETMRQTFVKNKANIHTYIQNSGLTDVSTCVAELSDLISAYKIFYAAAKEVTSRNGTVRVTNLEGEIVELSRVTQSIESKIRLVDNRLVLRLKEYTRQKQEEVVAALAENRPKRKVVPSAEEGRIIQYRSQTKRMLSTFKSVTDFCLDIEFEGLGSQLVTLEPDGFEAMPLDIGKALEKPMSCIKHKIITSATLVHGKKFTRSLEYLGLPPADVVSAVYDSPFNLNEQAILYMPTHIPYPVWSGHKNVIGRKQWIKVLTQEILQLVDCTYGDAFVLFGATQDMKDVIEEAGPDWWDEKGINLCVQETVARRTYDKFMSKDHSVIFGLKSFWEGIDIPGDKLKIVILPKLPLKPHKGALVEALQDRAKAKGLNGYNEIIVPDMIDDVRQGLGRLIRSQTDRGVLAILDPKIHTAAVSAHTHTLQMMRRHNKLHYPNGKPIPNAVYVPPGYAKELLDLLGFRQKTASIKDIDNQVREWFNLMRLNLR